MDSARPPRRDLAYGPWNDLHVLHIARNMRPVDAAEIFATRPDCDAFALYRDLAAIGPGHLWFEVVRPMTSMVPLAWMGVVATSPRNGVAHLAATPDLSLADATMIAARIRTRVIPALTAAGLIRVEAHSLASYRWAHRFLQRSGAVPEGPPRPNVGKAGEAFQTFVWLADVNPDPNTNPNT